MGWMKLSMGPRQPPNKVGTTHHSGESCKEG
jgi:hypothetical protein